MAPGQRSITAPEGVIHHFPSDGGENETSEWAGARRGRVRRGQSQRKYRATGRWKKINEEKQVA